jgi:glycosyltransferase involved in cell wall biosynthesis
LNKKHRDDIESTKLSLRNGALKVTNGIIVVQAGAIEKDGIVHIPPHWHFILKAYGELLPGTELVCRKDESLKNKVTLPVPEGLKAVLLEKLDSNSVIERFKGYIQARRKLRKLISRAEFVGAVLPSNLGNMAAKIAIHLKKLLFVEVAGENKLYDKRISAKLPLRYFAYMYTKNIDLKVIRQADCVLYVSRYLVDILAHRPKEYAVVPCTTVYDRDIFRREDTCRDSKIKLFSVNRAVREKGLQYLLLAIKKLREEGFDAVATLAGDGDYLNELKRQSCALGLGNSICFSGYVTYDELWRLHRNSDIFVLPTIASGEGTPRCLIEAMASSCPVVASSVGGIKIMFEEAQSGKLVTAGSIDELVDAIKLIITNTDLRRNYIVNGLKWAAEATLEKRMEKIRQTIGKILPQKYLKATNHV